jgi:hypothetical protein
MSSSHKGKEHSLETRKKISKSLKKKKSVCKILDPWSPF